jgi:hypothetical protein
MVDASPHEWIPTMRPHRWVRARRSVRNAERWIRRTRTAWMAMLALIAGTVSCPHLLAVRTRVVCPSNRLWPSRRRHHGAMRILILAGIRFLDRARRGPGTRRHRHVVQPPGWDEGLAPLKDRLSTQSWRILCRRGPRPDGGKQLAVHRGPIGLSSDAAGPRPGPSGKIAPLRRRPGPAGHGPAAGGWRQSGWPQPSVFCVELNEESIAKLNSMRGAAHPV